ncbi:hypothetical protein [Kitasatospora sp. NPDC098663]|uniref:hypothetical protein n=1 Tax=Kitasatospora sp. NPDC098663 TaxID=3364096 RepID=UPI003805AC94
MQELRFENDVRFTLELDEQVWLNRSIGGHELRVQAAVSVSPLSEAGRFLSLEATLFGFAASPINRAQLGRVTANLAYTRTVTVHQQALVFPLTTVQFHAIEAGRSGDARFEVEVSATLPQAAGYPGTAIIVGRFRRHRAWRVALRGTASRPGLACRTPWFSRCPSLRSDRPGGPARA